MTYQRVIHTLGIVVLLAGVLLAPATAAQAQEGDSSVWLPIVGGVQPTPAEFAAGAGVAELPVYQTGYLGQSWYRIAAAPNWNGVLLVFVHGYERERAEEMPGAWPPPLDGGLAEGLVSQGYGVAASYFRGFGWAVKEGAQDTHKVTNLFTSRVGKPKTTVIIGTSLGGLIAADLVESHRQLYDGSIAACAPMAGAAPAFDRILTANLAFAALFGWPSTWGTPWDVKDDINFNVDVLPVFGTLQAADPLFPVKLKFWQLVSHTPGNLPGDNLSADLIGALLWYSTVGLAEMEQRAGGPVVQNVGADYSLTQDQIDALQVYLLPGTVQGWLDAMNEHAGIVASPNARNYREHYYTPTGSLHAPMVTLHNVVDPLDLVENERVYFDTVAAAGASEWLLQGYVATPGHCVFTPDQMMQALYALNTWLGGTKPPLAVAFPAALGFDPTYTPGPWPQ